jgi:DNA-nicking Smr family endonuclease
MTRSPRKSGRHTAAVEDDAALWTHVARTVKPVKKKSRVTEVEIEEVVLLTKRRDNGPIPPAKGATKKSPEPIKSTPVKRTPPIAEFDRRTAKKVGAGRIEIEARLDLHGQRLDEAYTALRRFLFRCHANDQRLVLVITGKGRTTADPYAPFDMGAEGRSRGVIRQSVPRWLDEPDVRAIVVSYTEASARHGGAGALYVRLRKSG